MRPPTTRTANRAARFSDVVSLMQSGELVIRTLGCDAAEIVYIKAVATAYDGLCCLFSTGGQQISLVAPKGREAELDLLVDDLASELKLRRIAQE